MNRKAWVVQRPRSPDGIDMAALEQVGEVSYLLPSAPNIHDDARIYDDTERMVAALRSASPDDVFTTIGGSPLSQIMFGIALERSGLPSFNFGLYSRGRDVDGRRGAERGSYRVVSVPLA